MKLVGLFNPRGTNSCFSIPIFEDEGSYYTQVLAETDLIACFDPCSLPKHDFKALESPYDVPIGTPGRFAFFFSPSEIICGSKDEVRLALVNRLSDFSSRPFLEYELADFLNDADARYEASQKCREAIFKSALENLPEDLRKPNRVPTVVNLIVRKNCGLSPSEAVKQMDKRLSMEKKALLDLKLPRIPGTKKDKAEKENRWLVKDGVEIEIDTLRARLIQVLRDFPEIWNTCQDEIAEIEPISDIYRIFRDWHKEDGLSVLATRLSQCNSYEALRRYNHPLLGIGKLAARLEESDPDTEAIDQLVFVLRNGESNPGGKRITGRLTRALQYLFPKLAECLEGLVWNNLVGSLTATARHNILRTAEQLVAYLPERKNQPHFRVQDLAWRAVLLDKAGERSQAAAHAKDALLRAQSLQPGSNLYMWWSRLGDANRIVAKTSGDYVHPGWTQCRVHYQQALSLSDEDGKIMLYIRIAEALADQLELMFGTGPRLETALKMRSIAISGCEIVRGIAKHASDSAGPLFLEARLRASLALASEIAMSNQATVAVTEQEFEMAVYAVLQRNPLHTGAIWLAWRFYIEKGSEHRAFQWIDAQVVMLRKTIDERSRKIADYLEFQAACYMADLGQQDEARRRFQLITTTQPKNADVRRNLCRIGLESSQEYLAQQRYEKTYHQSVGSQARRDHAAEALILNQPLVNADPDKQDAIPWTRHARLFLLLDEIDKALGILEELLDKYPRDPYVWFHLGEAYFRQGVDSETKDSGSNTQESYSHATTAFIKAWEITPRVDTAHRLAACWARRGDVEEATRMLLEAEKLEPEDGWTKFSLGRIYYQSGNYDAALRAWIEALQCFAKSDEQMDQRRMGLTKQTANAIIRFAEDPMVTEVPLERLGSSALHMLASAATSVGWNRSRIVESIGNRLDSLPLLVRRKVPHALRAHLLYLQLAEGDDVAYQWHKRWYEKLGAVADPKLLFEYASGAKGAFRRAALWSLSTLMNSVPHSLLGTATGMLDEKRWGEFLRVVSTWGTQQNYYLNAYAAWPSDAVSCDELWAVVCRLNASLFHAALDEGGFDPTLPNPANLLKGANRLPLEFEMLPANALDPDAPASLLVQTDELFSQILLNKSKDTVGRYAVSEVKKSWDISGNLLRSSFYDGAAVPSFEVESLRILASRCDVEVTTNENRGLNLTWATSSLLEEGRMASP